MLPLKGRIREPNELNYVISALKVIGQRLPLISACLADVLGAFCEPGLFILPKPGLFWLMCLSAA